jgi:hypothetical protein
MAVTITRTPFIDDDGTGTTGTVLNNALHTVQYNQIDAALAKVAQLAGGNTFTGAQNFNGGDVTINGAGQNARFTVREADTRNAISIVNTSATNALFYVVFYNSASGVVGFINQVNATTVAYATSSDARLKTDRGRATDLAALRAVVVHDFTWTAGGQSDRGIFAQEAAGVFPRAILPGTDARTATGQLARPWATDYSKFVPDLIAGWQQHDADLAELRALLTTEGL